MHILGPDAKQEDLYTLEGAQKFRAEVQSTGPQYIINLRRNKVGLSFRVPNIDQV